MFEESLLESAHQLRTQSRWPTVASFALQATLATVIVAIPILHPEVVPLRAPSLQLTAPVPPAPKPPPPIQRITVDTANPASMSVPATATPQQNVRLTPTLDPTHFSDAPPATGTSINMASNGNSLDPALASTGTGGPTVIVTTPARIGPARISKGVSAGLLLAPIHPVYPPIARVAHQEGTVTIHAIISKEGRVESAAATDGPAMLRAAALDAVRSARYRPYLLNGEPTEVDTTFSIVFRLGQ